MSRDAEAVFAAIERWVEAGLLDADTAGGLRREAAGHAGSGTRDLTRYLVAATGGIALTIAGGLFLDWAWDWLDRGGRAALLGVAGVSVLVLGVRFEGARRWLPASYALQTSGLGLLLGAFAYSEGLWEDQTAGGIAVGVLALGLPIVLAPRAMKRSVVMPAVHLAFGLAFLAVFLDRAASLDGDAIVWILDGTLLLSIVTLLRLIVTDPGGDRHPWALNAFATAMLAGFFLVFWTAVDVLSTTDDVIFALDAWLLLTVAIVLWGRHAGPPGLPRAWLGRPLGLLGLVWMPFGLFTAFEQGVAPDAEAALLLLGGAGAAEFVYASREGLRSLMLVGSLSFVLGLWVWAVDRGGALGAVAALLLTAALLFLLSGRIGGGEAGGQG